MTQISPHIPPKILPAIPALGLQSKGAYAKGVYENMIKNRDKLNYIARLFVPISPSPIIDPGAGDTEAQADAKREELTKLAEQARNIDMNYRIAEWVPVVGTFAGIRQMVFAASMPREYLENKGEHFLRGVVATTSLGFLALGLPSCMLGSCVQDPS